MQKVEPVVESLDPTFTFLLDGGLSIYIWAGPKVSRPAQIILPKLGDLQWKSAKHHLKSF